METWRPVPGWTHYEVSTRGRVKNTRTGNIRKPYVSGSRDYLKIDLCDGNRRLKEYIHRLVMLAHCGDIPPNCQIHHKNARRDDNRLTNLQIVYPSQNVREAAQRKVNRAIVQLELQLFAEAA